MTALDWLILFIVAASVVLALSQGIIVELFSLGGAVVGMVGAAWGYPVLTPLFQAFVKLTPLAQLLGFLTIFFALFLAMGVTGRLLSRAAKETGMRWADRLLGAAFGLVRGIVLAAVLVLA
nr:CvpA family protein [Acidobacteriota bacterium]